MCLCICTRLVVEPPPAIFYNCKKMHCSSGEEGGKGAEGRWAGKEAEAWLFTLGLSSLSCHQSSEMWEHRPANTLFQFHLAQDLLRHEKMRKKKAILQCPKRGKRIRHAQRNLTVLSRRQYQQKNVLGFQIKMVFHQAKAISNLHLARPLIVMKYFLWTL